MSFSRSTEAEVLAHARELVRTTLRSLHGDRYRPRRGKGAFGQLVEELHFGYAPNSNPAKDFAEADLELKATGVTRTSRGAWRAKERLVLSVIDYVGLAIEPSFEESSLLSKSGRVLLVVYRWVETEDPADHLVLLVDVMDLNTFDPRDRAIIAHDWSKIQEETRAGRAHELSEGMTNYLVAARKGAGHGRDMRRQPFNAVRAPQRAFSLKASFVTRQLDAMFTRQAASERSTEATRFITDARELRESSVEGAVEQRIAPFYGRSVQELHRSVAPEVRTSGKAFYATLVRRMLGVTTRSIEEFDRADITLKVVRLGQRGRPMESLSFPSFRYRDLVTQSWPESDLRNQLTRRFLFVFFRYDGQGVLRLNHAGFWGMPADDLDVQVRRAWVETIRRIRRGAAHDLPNATFNGIVHVRPHARNARDTDETPDGQHLVKKSFWLNASYIASIYESMKTA